MQDEHLFHAPAWHPQESRLRTSTCQASGPGPRRPPRPSLAHTLPATVLRFNRGRREEGSAVGQLAQGTDHRLALWGWRTPSGSSVCGSWPPGECDGQGRTETQGGGLQKPGKEHQVGVWLRGAHISLHLLYARSGARLLTWPVQPSDPAKRVSDEVLWLPEQGWVELEPRFTPPPGGWLASGESVRHEGLTSGAAQGQLGWRPG